MSEAQEMFEKLQRSDEDLYLKIKELQEQLAALHAEVKALRDERETKQEEPPAQASTEISSEDDSVFDEIVGMLERRSAKAAKRSEMPLYRMKGNMVYLGEYPQSLKESGVTVSDEKDNPRTR